MKTLQILPVILVVSAVFHCSEEASLSPQKLFRHADPEIQKAFEADIVQNSTGLPKTCTESTDYTSGIQVVHPQPGFGSPFEVFCDQDYDGGGWTVIQNRFDGSVMFYQDWNTYEKGFGDLNGEFWLGLRKIHELTNAKEHELAVLLEAWDGDTAIAKYSRFAIGNPSSQYKLIRLGKYSGNAGDSLRPHHYKKFSTPDKDNDDWKEGNCAARSRSGWWFYDCSYCNLNGWYWKNEDVNFGNYWTTYSGNFLRGTRMMIRAVCEV